jgi:hypothetical protein
MVSKDTWEVSGVGSMVCMFNRGKLLLRNSRFIDTFFGDSGVISRLYVAERGNLT